MYDIFLSISTHFFGYAKKRVEKVEFIRYKCKAHQGILKTKNKKKEKKLPSGSSGGIYEIQ